MSETLGDILATPIADQLRELNKPNLCPSCGCNWDIIPEMLAEGVYSDNFQTAIKILGNCSECNAQFKGDTE